LSPYMSNLGSPQKNCSPLQQAHEWRLAAIGDKPTVVTELLAVYEPN